MLSDLYHALNSFKSEFSREKSWLLFCAIILSFLAAAEMGGVTSMCRYWLAGESGYHRLLHFFSCTVLLSGFITCVLASLCFVHRSNRRRGGTGCLTGRSYTYRQRRWSDAGGGLATGDLGNPK